MPSVLPLLPGARGTSAAFDGRSGAPGWSRVWGQKGFFPPSAAAFLRAGRVAAGQAGPGGRCCLPPSSQPPARSWVTPVPAFTPRSCADVCLVSLRRAQTPTRPGWVFAEGHGGDEAASRGRATHPCFLRPPEPVTHHPVITAAAVSYSGCPLPPLSTDVCPPPGTASSWLRWQVGGCSRWGACCSPLSGGWGRCHLGVTRGGHTAELSPLQRVGGAAPRLRGALAVPSPGRDVAGGADTGCR